MSFGEILKEQSVEEKIEIKVPDKIFAEKDKDINDQVDHSDCARELVKLMGEDPNLSRVLLSLSLTEPNGDRTMTEDEMLNWLKYVDCTTHYPDMDPDMDEISAKIARSKFFGSRFEFLSGAGYIYGALKQANSKGCELPKIGDELAETFLTGRLAKEIFSNSLSLHTQVKEEFPDIYESVEGLYIAGDEGFSTGAYLVFALLKTAEEETKSPISTPKNGDTPTDAPDIEPNNDTSHSKNVIDPSYSRESAFMSEVYNNLHSLLHNLDILYGEGLEALLDENYVKTIIREIEMSEMGTTNNPYELAVRIANRLAKKQKTNVSSSNSSHVQSQSSMHMSR